MEVLATLGVIYSNQAERRYYSVDHSFIVLPLRNNQVAPKAYTKLYTFVTSGFVFYCSTIPLSLEL